MPRTGTPLMHSCGRVLLAYRRNSAQIESRPFVLVPRVQVHLHSWGRYSYLCPLFEILVSGHAYLRQYYKFFPPIPHSQKVTGATRQMGKKV